MDSSKEKRYDEMMEEFKYVYENLPLLMGSDSGVVTAILVASEHHNSDIGQLAEFIRQNTVARKNTDTVPNLFTSGTD